jgi:SAM-dependent methyltransferase
MAEHGDRVPGGSRMIEQQTLREQVAYYRARAPEYRHIPPQTDHALSVARQRLLEIGRVARVLELASGTGAWTQELTQLSDAVTAIDASPEMIAINKQRVADPRVVYQQADLFEWEPQDAYDLVFFAFWLSHVPEDRLHPFLHRVRRAVRPGGHLFIVDQCDDFPGEPPEREGQLQRRTLSDGRMFSIVKLYYHPALLARGLRPFGFDAEAERLGMFFYLRATRSE